MKTSVLIMCVVVLVAVHCEASPSPIILLPGVMGSQLRVMDESPVCATGRKYKELWVSPLRLTLHNHCASRELPLLYNPATNSYHNNTKVRISVPGFGDTRSVEYLNPGQLFDSFQYFHKMVDYFVDRGYKRGESIRGAPYDWRLAADELEKRGYFDRLKSLVEDTYRRNGNTKVTLVVHSMGGPVSLHFLTGFRGVNQAWKNKYIHAYVPLSAAWSGGSATVQAVVSGYHGVPDLISFAYKLINKFLVPLARSFESIPWLFPKPSVFGNAVLVATPSKRYTANNYEQLFRDIKVPNVYRAYKRVQAINPNYPAPNVPTYCFYGVGVKTPEKFTYPKDLTAENSIGMKAKIAYSDGDGSVNTISSRVCHKWSGMSAKFEYKTYNKVDHMKITSDGQVLKDIGAIVGAPAPKKSSWLSELFE